MDLLRFATAGSVDDGKSTLIGRLLYDSKAIFEDQLESVEATSQQRGYDYTDLALLTDGLRSEREQGITIDVAYRYFATPKRKFIIADTPGHTQYTRNMVTGASTANLGLVLVDARQGLSEQSRRHAVILSLLRVPHMVLAINKMDLVGWDQTVYDKIREEFSAFASKLSIPDLEVIPISALLGDNVVTRSENMPWYQGASLMHHLEHVNIASDRDLIGTRFPVQYVIRPKSDDFHDYRGYAGRIAGGVLKPGDEVVVLPSGMPTRIESIEFFGQEVDEAFNPMSVTVRLEDDIDVSRGDMICRPHNAPTPTQDIDAMICWMTNEPLRDAPETGHQADHAVGAGDGPGSSLPARREHAAPRSGRDRTRPQRDRPGAPAHDGPAHHRPVPQEPLDRVVHPDRRRHRRNGRRRHDHWLTVNLWSAPSAAGSSGSVAGLRPAGKAKGRRSCGNACLDIHAVFRRMNRRLGGHGGLYVGA